MNTHTLTHTYKQAVRLDKVIGRGVTAENSEASGVFTSARSHDALCYTHSLAIVLHIFRMCVCDTFVLMNTDRYSVIGYILEIGIYRQKVWHLSSSHRHTPV